MSTNLEYRAGERQRKRKRESRRQAAGQRSSTRERATEVLSETGLKTEETFLLEEQHENFVAAATKWEMLAATNGR